MADHSSRGVLPTVVRRCVWSRNLVNEGAMAHWRAVAPKTNPLSHNRIEPWMVQTIAQSLHKLRYPGCKKKWFSKETYGDSIPLTPPTHHSPLFNVEKYGTRLQHLFGKFSDSLHNRRRFRDSSSKFRVQSLH